MRSPRQAPSAGLELREPDEPRLFAALREAADRAGARRVEGVRLEPGAALALRAASALRLLSGRRRVLHLGLFALDALTVGELQAVATREIAGPGSAADGAPAQADVALGDALRKLAANEALFARHALSLATGLRRAGQPCEDVYACLRAAREALSAALAPDRPLLSPDQCRLAVRAAIGASGPIAHGGAPALSLLSDPEGAARALSAHLDEAARARLSRSGEPEAPSGRRLGLEEQALFAASQLLHDEAVDLSQRKLPGVDALVLASLQHLEAALGPQDALLVPALANGARAYSRRGEFPAAHEALQRALALHLSLADPDPNETIRLQTLLDRVRESLAA